MAHRERGQALEARIAEHLMLAAQHAGCGWPRKRIHRPIDLHQQRHILWRVAPHEGMLGRAVALGQGRATDPPSHQARDLRPAVAAELLQVLQQHPALASLAAPVVEPPQHRPDPRVACRVVSARAKIQRLSPGHHLAHLFERAHLCLVHVDHHRLDDRPLAQKLIVSFLITPESVQAHTSLESGLPLQAHTSLEKTSR